MPKNSSRMTRADRVAFGELNSRYYRVKVTLDGKTLDQQGFVSTPNEKYYLEDAVAINLRSDPFPYDAVGRCIYCGATERLPNTALKPSDEHIVAEGIGGSLVLPEASCQRHADITSAIEGDVQKQLLLAPKRALGIVGKNKSPSDTVMLTTLKNGRTSSPLFLRINDHPAILFLMLLRLPNILEGRPDPMNSGLAGMWVHMINSFDAVKALGVRELAWPPFDTVRFCQFLAKTAHAFAAAAARNLDYQPLLIEFIERKVGRRGPHPDCYNFVGGVPKFFAPSTALHELALRIAESQGVFYLVVHIRLFAHLGGPVYSVVVGKLNQTPPVLDRAKL